MMVLAYYYSVIVYSISYTIYLRFASRMMYGAIVSMVILSSHGLCSIGYNHYFPQLIASAILISYISVEYMHADKKIEIWPFVVMAVYLSYYPLLPIAVLSSIYFMFLRHRAVA
jgi:hypothetical protein